MSGPYRIRPAGRHDVAVLVEFTLREAHDAEGVALDPAAARRGVERAFEPAPPSRYWVAEAADGTLAGSTSICTEWSNFHGGEYWWVQSLFVHPEHRGAGLVDQLIDHLTREAAGAGALDLRLYAHEANARAQRVYTRAGFTRAPYVLMRRSLTPDP